MEKKTPLRVSSAGWEFKKSRLTIEHPLGLFLSFDASHPKALALVSFAQECIEWLEKNNATQDWSV